MKHNTLLLHQIIQINFTSITLGNISNILNSEQMSLPAVHIQKHTELIFDSASIKQL